ncbi:MAG TPA: DinB family protein [Candidatus Nanoarchaeia archaeon]|nr:DinB family protein [Candidatus Nanoarchaeia archaeon]
MHTYLQRCLDSVDTAIRPMTEHELTIRRGGKWSAAEIIEHLALAYGGTAKMLERLSGQLSVERIRPTLKQRVIAMLVVELGYFPPGREAPEFTKPTGITAHDAVAAFRANLHKMDQALEKCERRFGKTAIISRHPILGPLSLRQWRRFHWVHTRHHAKQLLALRGGVSSAAAS